MEEHLEDLEPAEPLPHIEFKVGDNVVYPHHGAGKVIRKEVKDILGDKREYLTIKILHNDMTVMVPTENAALAGLRRVIDVSGDGVNNMGPPVTLMRDDVLGSGITINGLPIMLKRQVGYGMWEMQFENLDIYYEDCVIGGPGSFVIPIKERAQFKEATRQKLVLEIAGRTPERPIIPAQARRPRVYCS